MLHVVLPYAAIVVFIVGLVWRYRSRATISARSSQILENRWLILGSVPFHLGIAILVAGHLVPLLLPSLWQSLVSQRNALLTVETIGVGAALLCLTGLVVLFIRRVASAEVRASSTTFDTIVLALLIVEVSTGLGVASLYRWGSVWSAGVTTPYLRSIFTLRPDPSFVAALPLLVQVHLAGAWILLASIPFTRLVHMFSLPLGALGRRPQKVVWATPRPRS